jgi:tRNA threonylcarbamoyl adenosine modification protein (Sua5/YciO/YrdC/YwlC family)
MERCSVHPEDPQPRMIARAVASMQKGHVIAYPTDSGYALGCVLGARDAVEEIRRIRDLPKDHNFTLMCRDLSELSQYAMVGNAVFRYVKERIPGPYTFILNATKLVPKRLLHPKRKTLGLRICGNAVVQAVLEELDEPMMSVSLQLPILDRYVADSEAIYEALMPYVGVFLDAGESRIDPTTIVDCSDGEFTVIRD